MTSRSVFSVLRSGAFWLRDLILACAILAGVFLCGPGGILLLGLVAAPVVWLHKTATRHREGRRGTETKDRSWWGRAASAAAVVVADTTLLAGTVAGVVMMYRAGGSSKVGSLPWELAYAAALTLAAVCATTLVLFRWPGDRT